MATRKKGDDHPFTLTDSNNDKEKPTYQERKHQRVNIPYDIVTKANEGDVMAQLELGKLYYNTISIENNDIIAFNWIYRSAEQGNMEAQFRLGDMYALGFGTVKKLPDSYEWYTKAAIQGYKKALIRVHNLYQQDIKMHCRGQLNSDEEEWASNDFKKKNNIRELYEYRLEQNKSVLSNIIEYYTHKFKYYQSVNQSNPDVQLNLAFLYQHGYGTKKCSRWAFEYYTLAAEEGDTDAQYNLGRLYQQHCRKKFNYRDAFKWYTKAAEGRHIAAQRYLAYFYLKGLAIDIDYEMAVYWYTRAAEGGDSLAQVTLGMLYRKGDYIKQDLSMAVSWYSLAARQGNFVAQNCLSKLHRHGMLHTIKLDEDMLEYLTDDSMNNRIRSKLSLDISQQEDFLEFEQINKLVKCALIGDGSAMFEIGLKYYHGYNGFPQNKDTGIQWIKNASNREHKDAQFMMANLYKEGDSIEQDYRKSNIWYKKIAQKKDADAQYQIGIMYNKGLGVRKDPLEASKWFTWAADQENSDAQYSLGILRFNGIGIREDKKEATDWFYKSVHQKNIHACYKLGKIYFEDMDNPKKNFEPSLKILKFAAKHGSVKAQLFLGSIYKSGYRVQRNLRKSIAFYTQAADFDSAEAQYILAIIHLMGDGVKHNYVKAYKLFKRSSVKNHKYASWLFQTPIQYDLNINDYSKVISMFIMATEKGIDNLAYEIGFIYEHGVTGYFYDIKDFAEAKKWYFVASKKADSRADYRLGIMREFGKGAKINMTKAAKNYDEAVKKENGDAIFRLACKYINRYDASHDLLEVVHIYTKASIILNKNTTDIRTVFEHDNDVVYTPENFDKDSKITIDKTKLISVLEKATEAGYTQLQYQLGVMYESNNDYRNAFKWFCLAAKIGITDAYYRLGVIYEEGKIVEQDYLMAAEMYQSASQKDHEGAYYRLGRLYQYGNGVKCDYLKAYDFYKKAADMYHKMAQRVLNITLEREKQPNRNIKENYYDFKSKEYQDSLKMYEYVGEQGNTEAQFKVGFVCEYIYSMPDYEKALKWYTMAAKNSHMEAMYHLGHLYEKGLGVSQNYQKAIQIYSQSFDLGSSDALFRLGRVYHHGKGVGIDPVKAVEYYTLSTKCGNPKYQYKIGRIYEEGELVQKNLLEAIKWYTKAYNQGYDRIGSKLYAMYEDKPYETFFFKKLFRILSIASCNQFRLNEYYDYEHLGNVNNRLGFMCHFGIGTEINLKKSLQYFLKEYSDKTKTTITEFRFFDYGDFSFSQKIDILKGFANDDECMNQFSPEELYDLGMMFYNGQIQLKRLKFNDKLLISTSINNQYSDDPHQCILIEKDYSSALKYLKKAADKCHVEALFQLGIMYYCGYGVQKNNDQGDKYFNLLPYGDIESTENMAILCHTHNDVKNFSKAFECYKHLEKLLVKDRHISGDQRKKISTLVQTGLGLLYEYGDGVERDYRKAFEYYKKLADDYCRMGYFRLGLMYYYGKGIPVDYETALNYFEWSFGGYFWGDKLPYVYYRNHLEESDDFQSERVYYVIKREEIYGEVNYHTGLIYKHAQGILKNEDKAQKYFKRALKWRCQRAASEIKD